jgi:hypothetical protein
MSLQNSPSLHAYSIVGALPNISSITLYQKFMKIDLLRGQGHEFSDRKDE